jgi:hypothetical protein
MRNIIKETQQEAQNCTLFHPRIVIKQFLTHQMGKHLPQTA